MTVNSAHQQLLEICDRNSTVWIERTTQKGHISWSIRWHTPEGVPSKNRIQLASQTRVNYPTESAAFNDWFTVGNHKAVPTSEDMPSDLKEWILELRA